MAEALRFNEGKPKLSYFMRSFRWMTAAVARVKEFGANKYMEDNWRAGNKPDTEYLDSCFRHLDYFFGGEFYDQDSGCSHLAHAVWNLSALAELNHSERPIIDEELFRDRMAYWAEKKREREAAAEADTLGRAIADEVRAGTIEPIHPPLWREHIKQECMDACGMYTSICDDGCQDAVTSPQVAQDATPGSCPVDTASERECPVCGSDVVWEEATHWECECGECFDFQFDDEPVETHPTEGKDIGGIRFHIPMTPEMKAQCEDIRARLNDIVLRSHNPGRDV